ncbi:MAG: nucleoside-diphosphate sugar epimerase/dehydratase [Acholeplasmataceae bacterium]|nr:nucleoside-diphosphate sugar epimerase/dehydratase [Acholeplasmataceae bacterium]
MEHKHSTKTTRFLKLILVDAIMIALTYVLAIFMFKAINRPVDLNQALIAVPIIIVYKIIVFYLLGFYKILDRHFGFEDVVKISLVIVFSNLTIVGVIFLFQHLYTINVISYDLNFMFKSAYIFITITEIAFILFPRVIHRLLKLIQRMIEFRSLSGKRTLIIGAGLAGEYVIKEIIKNKQLDNIPLVILDDNPDKFNKILLGINIYGPISDLESYIVKFKIEEIIVAISDFPHKKLSDVIESATKFNIKVKKLLSISDVDDKINITDVRIEDLLNRDEISLDDDSIGDFINGQTVLVTGGGGSIGSELCRQIAQFSPKKLVIFDIYENNTYDIQQELLRKFTKANKPLDLEVYIGSVYNYTRTKYIFDKVKPDLVFHAAAYKHVPLMEDSSVEAVRTNVLGTHNVAMLSEQYGVKKFVLVSSDKAVRSTNLMGATKRYAELVIQEQQSNSVNTKFSAVRFGNVLGSNGSVIPLFKKQIADGGPVTVTHPEITRYFMTIPEAVGLILQCAVYANGGEIFILDMGEPVKIVDLAKKMIRLAGYVPNQDINIVFTGLRPGEKLYEELLVNGNSNEHIKTENHKILIEKQGLVESKQLEYDTILDTLDSMNNEEVKKFVQSVIKTYKPDLNNH